jgi:hypothetical protein
MFRSKQKAQKVHFDISVNSVEVSLSLFDPLIYQNIPAKYTDIKVSIARGAKAAVTKVVQPKNQRADFDSMKGLMSLICTLYQSSGGRYESKEYKLSIVRVGAAPFLITAPAQQSRGERRALHWIRHDRSRKSGSS